MKPCGVASVTTEQAPLNDMLSTLGLSRCWLVYLRKIIALEFVEVIPDDADTQDILRNLVQIGAPGHKLPLLARVI